MELIDERSCVAYRLTFKRTMNEGETIEDLEKIPRTETGWPCERDFAKWPIVEQEEWVGAAVWGYLEDGLEKGGGKEEGPAMDEAWRNVLDYLKHVGIQLDPPDRLGDATAHDLLLAHYANGRGGYDCSQVASDFGSQPDLVERIRYLQKQQREKIAARRKQKRDSKKRRGARKRATAQTERASARMETADQLN